MPNVLGPLEGPLQQVLMAFTGALHSYGLAIIVFTLLVRAVLTPLNLRALRSQKKMAALAPRIKEIQQRYKGNREEVTRQQMALYKEEGVNPAGGCLPLLIQMPILYSLFFIFRTLAKTPHVGATAIYHQKFLWFVLDKPDSLFGPFIIHGSYWGPLALLAGLFQWVQSRMMMQPTSDPQQRTTQQIMQFMPLLIIVFAVNYPAGLALYWVVTTLYSIGLQYFITGWGQLFKSPFRIPHATPATGVTAGPRGQGGPGPAASAPNGKGSSRPGTPSPLRSPAPRTDGKRTATAGDDTEPQEGTITTEVGPRMGKMQRAAMRPKTRPRRSR